MTALGAVVDPFAWWGRVTPDAPALRDRGRGVVRSYRDLDDDATRWAEHLRSRGVGPGHRVGALASNRHELVSLLYGCVRVGAALVPLNWRLAPAELARVIEDARLSLLVVEQGMDTVHPATGERAPARLDLDRDVPAVLSAPRPPRDGPLDATRLDPEAPALVLYTSGSTGRPKGAVLPYRQLLFNAWATCSAWQLGADDVGPISTPFFHTGGWNVFATPLWQAGGCVVLMPAFDPATFLQVLGEEGCTIAFAVPTQYVMLCEDPSWGRALPRLKWFISGGAPCPASLQARIRAAGYRLREGFGMTEFGPNCFAIGADTALSKPGSVGWPVPFVEMRLVDDAGRDVPDGQVGELWLRGPQRFAGYLFSPDRTAEALTLDGWYRSGDLFARDADGAYYVRGRRKQMFISGGENVYPGEVEAALGECDGVAEAVVVGIPDAKWGEVGCAFVQPRGGQTVAPDALLAELRDRLAHYKVPKRLVVLDALPRLATGKVDRNALELEARL